MLNFINHRFSLSLIQRGNDFSADMNGIRLRANYFKTLCIPKPTEILRDNCHSFAFKKNIRRTSHNNLAPCLFFVWCTS